MGDTGWQDAHSWVGCPAGVRGKPVQVTAWLSQRAVEHTARCQVERQGQVVVCVPGMIWSVWEPVLLGCHALSLTPHLPMSPDIRVLSGVGKEDAYGD